MFHKRELLDKELDTVAPRVIEPLAPHLTEERVRKIIDERLEQADLAGWKQEIRNLQEDVRALSNITNSKHSGLADSTVALQKLQAHAKLIENRVQLILGHVEMQLVKVPATYEHEELRPIQKKVKA